MTYESMQLNYYSTPDAFREIVYSEKIKIDRSSL